jgi:hypothetical protein
MSSAPQNNLDADKCVRFVLISFLSVCAAFLLYNVLTRDTSSNKCYSDIDLGAASKETIESLRSKMNKRFADIKTNSTIPLTSHGGVPLVPMRLGGDQVSTTPAYYMIPKAPLPGAFNYDIMRSGVGSYAIGNVIDPTY